MRIYYAVDIASYVINKCIDNNIRITNLKLQKLLYFIQIEFAKSDRRLIKEDFYAYKLGPTLPDLYAEFLPYASSCLPGQEKTTDIDTIDQIKIDSVLSQYAAKDVWELVELSSKTDPFKYNFEIFGPLSIIPFECISSFVNNIRISKK